MFFWQSPFCTAEELDLFTDASGSLGNRVFWYKHLSAGAWLEKWRSKGLTNNIILLEIFPVVITLELWGAQFYDRRILLCSHNKGSILYN